MDGDGSALTLIGPYGELVTRDMLPPAKTIRWVPRRKARVVCAIRGGLISRQEARDLYGISDEELLSWEKLYDDHGPSGLRATSIQRYRQVANSGEKKSELCPIKT